MGRDLPFQATSVLPQESSATTPAGDEHGSVPRVRVVLADDHERFRRGIARSLSDHEDIDLVAVVENGQEALRAASRFRPDVLVVDDRMPLLSGPEVARAIQRDPTLGAVRVALLTAWDGPDVVARANAAGIYAYIDKAQDRSLICAAIVTAAHAVRPPGPPQP